MKKNELLAPVGSIDALYAAILAGADAIYVGGRKFGARKEASFSDDDMIYIIKYCHFFDVQVYATINTLILDNEIEDVLEYISFLNSHNIDAIIIQDLGLLSLINKHFPKLEIHASTQLNSHNSETVKFLQSKNVKRIVLARENTVDEISHIYNETNVEIEAFIHGALCVSYSGQCLMSSLLGGRSGNRGQCAGTCRLPYDIDNSQSKHGDYLLSTKDLASFDTIEKIKNAGVYSFKIEGRLKGPEYVYTVVSYYRTLLDGSKNFEYDLDVIKSIFNRSFTSGFINNTENVIDSYKPNHRGILIGKISSYSRNRISFKSILPLENGDKLRFTQNGQESGITIKNLYKENNIYSCDCSNKVNQNTKIFLLSNEKVSNTLKSRYQKKKECYLYFEAKMNQPFNLSIYDNNGSYLTLESIDLCTKAKNHPITEERLSTNLSKANKLPINISSIEFNIENNLYISIKELNRVRRSLFEMFFDGQKLTENEHYNITIPKLNSKCSDRQFFISFHELNNLNSCIKYINTKDITIIYHNVYDFDKAFDFCQNNKIKIIPAFRRIVDDIYFERVKNLYQNYNFKEVFVGELGLYNYFNKLNVNTHLLSSFNITNKYSAQSLIRSNQYFIPSHELNNKQLITLSNIYNEQLILNVYGYTPVMVLKSCPISYAHNDEKYCNLCRERNYHLIDRKKIKFPLYFHKDCTVEVLNSIPTSLHTQLNTLKKFYNSSFHIDLYFENSKSAEEIITFYLNIYKSNYDVSLNNTIYTTGHFKKGIQM